MRKCTECGSTNIRKEHRDHRYAESGLSNVVIRKATFNVCDECGGEFHSIRAINQLHRAIAEFVARKESKLTPSEVRYLRKFLGYSNRDFAELLGMSEHQTSRWQSESQPDEITPIAERLLRLLVLSEHEPCDDYMRKDLMKTGTAAPRTDDIFLEDKSKRWIPALAS